VIPAGDGTLVELSGDISDLCLSGFIFSDSSGSGLEVEYNTDDSSDDGGAEASCSDGTDVCLSLDGGNLAMMDVLKVRLEVTQLQMDLQFQQVGLQY
jgi:hypothetical protein